MSASSPHNILDEARAFFEGTTERPLDHVEALAWDLLEQLEATQRERDLLWGITSQPGCGCGTCGATDRIRRAISNPASRQDA